MVFYSHDKNAEEVFQDISHLINQDADIDGLLLNEKCHPRWSKQQYLNAFNQVQEYIKAEIITRLILRKNLSLKRVVHY